jgi:uncharacterized protein
MNAPIERKDWFVTASGRRVYVLSPDPLQICLEDIAFALSQICRFGGHTSTFYSVAQHSIAVSRLVPERFAFHGLIHDATEAYLGDVIRPLKMQLPAYSTIEARWEIAIAERFNVDWTDDAYKAVKLADRIALITERRDLIVKHDWQWTEDELGILADSRPIVAWPPEVARQEFIQRWTEYP